MDKQKNKLIVLCGPDASGKSTLAKIIMDIFKKRGIDCEYMHAHTYSISSNSFGMSDKTLEKYKKILKLLVPLVLLDNIFTYHKKYKKILNKKMLILDRYFYDKIARLLYYEICCRKFAGWYLSLLPKPDHVFFLKTDPNTLYKRKQEYTVKEYEKYQKIYNFIAEKIGAFIIDTNLPIEFCQKKLVEYFFKS